MDTIRDVGMKCEAQTRYDLTWYESQQAVFTFIRSLNGTDCWPTGPFRTEHMFSSWKATAGISVGWDATRPGREPPATRWTMEANRVTCFRFLSVSFRTLICLDLDH